MRIISGKYAKRNLFTLKSNRTRPTSDKVKNPCLIHWDNFSMAAMYLIYTLVVVL